MLLDSILHQTPLETTHERLVSRRLAASTLSVPITGHQNGPLFHTVARCGGVISTPSTALVGELLNKPECPRCRWTENTHQGRLLTLASWWYSILDSQLPTPSWRSALLYHASTSSSSLSKFNLNPGVLSNLAPLRSQVQTKVFDLIDSSIAVSGIEKLHRSLAALALPAIVTPDRSRSFARWSAFTAALRPTIGQETDWEMQLHTAVHSPVTFLATLSNKPMPWASPFLDPEEFTAITEFYPAVLTAPLANGVLTGSLPPASLAGLASLGFVVVPTKGASRAVLEMASQLFDPNQLTELSNLQTAFDAASAIAR